MSSKEEAKRILSEAFKSLWTSDSETISNFFNEGAEITGFSPPKLTTWKGIDAITAHFKEIEPLISNKSFTITRIDIVEPGKIFYAAWEAEFEMKIPGREGTMGGNGIMYCVLEGGKFNTFTAYEDPTPFVAMAMKA